MTPRYVGLTWDHPRGYSALRAAAVEVAPAGLLQWEKQPLEGFESHPIGELVARYDLLVLDHPHVGEAAALDCLLPLEEVFSAEQVATWTRQTIGPAMDSYLWQGRHYALPLDVATQVAVCGPTFDGEAPDNWDAVMRLSEQAAVALSLAGPHAILCFFSLVLSLGAEPGTADLVNDKTVALEALSILRRLEARAPDFSRTLNPIALLEALGAGQPIAYVPLVYGYVNYATTAPGRRPVRFAEAPRGPSGRRGSVLGGTGVAVSHRAVPDDALIEHLCWLMSESSQSRYLPKHAGQPSARAAWQSAAVNQATGGFFERTIETTEAAWVRPRFDGYIAFQTAGAEIIRQGLAAYDSPSTIFAKLQERWHRARSAARGPLK